MGHRQETVQSLNSFTIAYLTNPCQAEASAMTDSALDLINGLVESAAAASIGSSTAASLEDVRASFTTRLRGGDRKRGSYSGRPCTSLVYDSYTSFHLPYKETSRF